MRDNVLLPLLLLLRCASTAKLDPILLPFEEPILVEQYIVDNTTTLPDFELKLIKRQNNGCATGYSNCATLGAAALCCPTSNVCAADSQGNVACCLTQASCTGTIKPPTTGGTVATTTTGGGSIAVVGGAGGTVATATTTTGAGGAGTTTGGIAFVGGTGTASGTQQTSDASRSYVNNPYFPYAYIPTTYANAAACSSAYTTCNADYSSCSSYLAGAAGAHGVTVSVSGGGGTTVVASVAPTTYAADVASSVCASLSGSACYGLTVEACAAFGSATVTSSGVAAAARCTGVKYAAGIGMGVAMGAMGYR
jgi:hypothetical protein